MCGQPSLGRIFSGLLWGLDSECVPKSAARLPGKCALLSCSSRNRYIHDIAAATAASCVCVVSAVMCVCLLHCASGRPCEFAACGRVRECPGVRVFFLGACVAAAATLGAAACMIRLLLLLPQSCWGSCASVRVMMIGGPGLRLLRVIPSTAGHRVWLSSRRRQGFVCAIRYGWVYEGRARDRRFICTADERSRADRRSCHYRAVFDSWPCCDGGPFAVLLPTALAVHVLLHRCFLAR